ncbi:response regulator [Variovorax sp. PAMC 28711]|uniref:response regulator n=1 Tax=Variovorax sp. PAMC 28711 TaxID=1795631 RepID=UPI00078D25EF|nr:response regulator [Variovorax sp. PAMC 28711]AMM23775.1 hypothetical protein AX767_05010 [Variovorax sp. PAMC 28711]
MDARLKTFIVEDNLTIRENLVGTLEELTRISAIGHAETEDDARTWFAKNPDGWELAIVDLFLRQGSGLGVVQALSSRKPAQKVVVLTNYATPDIRKRCARLGADVVFDKSNEIEGLVDYCLALVAAQQARLFNR